MKSFVEDTPGRFSYNEHELYNFGEPINRLNFYFELLDVRKFCENSVFVLNILSESSLFWPHLFEVI